MIAAAQDVHLRLLSAEALRSKLEASIARGWQDKDSELFYPHRPSLAGKRRARPVPDGSGKSPI